MTRNYPKEMLLGRHPVPRIAPNAFASGRAALNLLAKPLAAISLHLAILLMPAAAAPDPAVDCKRARQPEEKLKYCSAAIAQTRDRSQLERFYLRRGNAYMELKLYGDAKRDFDRMIALNPGIAGYYDNRMSALRELGQLQDALSDANRAVALAPNMAFTTRNRGLLFERMEIFDRALQDLERAAAAAPEDNGIIIDRARLKGKLGRAPEAIQELNGVIAREPGNLWAFRERGFVYLMTGDSANAERDLSLYAGTDPNDEEVRSTLVIIRGRGAGETGPANTLR